MKFVDSYIRPLYLLYISIFLTFLRHPQALQLTTGWKYITQNRNQPNEPEAADPGPRSGSSIWVSKDGLMMLFGGRGNDPRDNSSTTTLLSDLWGYNSTSDLWINFMDHQITRQSNASGNEGWKGPAGREMAAMCATKNGNRIVIFGGRIINNGTNETCAVTNQLLVLSLGKTLTWETHSCSHTPKPRYDVLYWCDEEHDVMRVMGGRGADGQVMDDAWILHLDNLTWVQLVNESKTGLRRVDKSALLWKLPDGSLYLMRDKVEETNSNTSDFIVQLWKSEKAINNSSDNWTLINESNQGQITWPGVHRHGGTCTDLEGNLWLFNGESEIDGQLYLNNDLWFYNVSSNVWSKVELTMSSHQPEQRHLSATWCHRNTLFTYGGSSCSDSNCVNLNLNSNFDCVIGDLWKLDISSNSNKAEIRTTTQVPTPTTKPNRGLKPDSIIVAYSTPNPVSSVMKNPPKSKAKDKTIISNAIPQLKTSPTSTTAAPTAVAETAKTNPVTKPPQNPVKSIPPSNNGTIIGVSITTAPFHDSGDASSAAILNHMINRASGDSVESEQSVEADDSTNHGVYGSAIFFGISITMFSLFGLVVFFRRCVSCPPRENLLLKEPPPVRYTVIPDDSYSI